MNVTKQHLLPTQYMRQKTPKTRIVLHHTVSSTAQSALRWWASTPQRIATAYIVETDGSIIECFESVFWAHHLGLKHKNNTTMNRLSIGIEIVNEGPLTNVRDEWRWFVTPQRPQGIPYRSEVCTLPKPWRGQQYFAAYRPAQYGAVAALCNELHKQFGIGLNICEHFECEDADAIWEKYDILHHANLRKDKTDLHPGFDFSLLKKLMAEL